MIGPLLFLLYVNNLPDVAINSKVALFADDSKCFRAIHSPADNDLLQFDLDSMCSWSVYWSLKFNAEKSFLLRISRKRQPSEYTYSISDAPISITDSHKDLGVVVSNNLKWSVHIAHCTS